MSLKPTLTLHGGINARPSLGALGSTMFKIFQCANQFTLGIFNMFGFFGVSISFCLLSVTENSILLKLYRWDLMGSEPCFLHFWCHFCLLKEQKGETFDSLWSSFYENTTPHPSNKKYAWDLLLLVSFWWHALVSLYATLRHSTSECIFCHMFTFSSRNHWSWDIHPTEK